jgi:hypothetical protein
MTIRRIQTHKECLEAFARELKRYVRDDLRVWRSANPEQAKIRAIVYSTIVGMLKEQAERHDIPLSDLGLVDYEVPPIED